MPGTPRPAALARSRRALRAWFEPRRDAYPWRRSRDPYRVLVSELMLQQTQASRVVPAYAAFLRRFPDVRSLARASRREVLLAWDGLGSLEIDERTPTTSPSRDSRPQETT